MLDDFLASDKNFTIKAGALKYDPNKEYEFLIKTIYHKRENFQILRVIVKSFNSIPVVSQRFLFYLKINDFYLLKQTDNHLS